jgi:hypothetical protein
MAADVVGADGPRAVCAPTARSAVAVPADRRVRVPVGLSHWRPRGARRHDRLAVLGLYAEEFDAETGRDLGSFPQAFWHLALIEAAARIIPAERLEET